MTVWTPANLSISVEDNILNLIIPSASLAGVPASCTQPLYQSTAAHALADFSAGLPNKTVTGVDVTNLVSCFSGFFG